MRKLFVLSVIVFGVALAGVVGNRLSNELIKTMVVVASAVCFIGASIPISLAFIIASSQNWGRAPRDDNE